MKKHWGTALLIVFAMLSVPLAVSAEVVERQFVTEVVSSDKITTYISEEPSLVDLGNGYTALLYLTESDAALTRSTTRRTLTSTMKIKNILGITIATLSAVGVFDTDGSKSHPYDAYGYGDIPNVQNPSNTLGPVQYNAYVKVNLTGFLPGGDTTFNYTCTIHCNANGQSSASWN